jgi:hypothetical protein
MDLQQPWSMKLKEIETRALVGTVLLMLLLLFSTALGLFEITFMMSNSFRGRADHP